MGGDEKPVKVRVSTRDIFLLCGVFEGLPLFLRLVEVSDSAEEGFGRYRKVSKYNRTPI